MGYLDHPLDWTRPELAQLRDFFVLAYRRRVRAEELADAAGIVPGTFPDYDNVRTVWTELINEMARQGKLRELVRQASLDPTLSEQLRGEFAAHLEPSAPTPGGGPPPSSGGQAARPGTEPKSLPTVLISYSRQDEAWKDRLAPQLKVLQKLGLLDPWDDDRIGVGVDWRPAMQAAMDRAAVAVLLISADYLSSDFVTGEEVPRLLQRRTNEGLRLIPVIVRPCPWKRVPWLEGIQPRPADGHPLASATPEQAEAHLAALAEEIAGIIEAAE